MNFLEIFGIIFLAVILLNVVIGVFALKAAAASEEEYDVAYNTNKLKMMVNN